MEKIRIAPAYDARYIEINRPTPLSDERLEAMVDEVLTGGLINVKNDVFDISNILEDWVFSSKLNQFSGYDKFQFKDVCIGCTQYIDNLYMQYGSYLQILENEYRYHKRLTLTSRVVTPLTLMPYTPLIISMPFCSIGAVHDDMDKILDHCLSLGIDVHIDGAWVTCARDIEFNFDHPAIKSFAISLSKGLGLGWNRVAVRWSRSKQSDSIGIMNDFNMLNKITLAVGCYYMKNCESDYLWNNYGDKYYKVCNDFNLTPTNSIHLALDNGQARGISPLVRFLCSSK